MSSIVSTYSQFHISTDSILFYFQTNDVTAVRVLLAFGADVNLVNSRQHSPLDIATLSWITYERRAKISNATNNMATVNGNNPPRINSKMCPDVNSSPIPSPPLERAHLALSRTEFSSSWVIVENETLSSSGENGENGSSDRPALVLSSEDTRGFTSSVMPIKSTDLVEEVLDDPTAPSSAGSTSPSLLLKAIGTILNLLYSIGAKSGKAVLHRFQKVPLLTSFSESDDFQKQLDARQILSPFREGAGVEMERSVKIRDFMEGRTVFSLYEELEHNINLMLESQSSLSTSPDEYIAITMQQKEMMKFRKTGGSRETMKGIGFQVNGGSRLLFLDGGGIKGLVQIEVLRQLEEATGRKITQLFDWIIGSSIGGILALGLVYGKQQLLLPMGCVVNAELADKIKGHHY